MKQVSKAFFFEKKKQKTFASLRGRLADAIQGQTNARPILALFLLLAPAPAPAQVRSVNLQAPQRDFGYFAGDIVASTAVITVAPGTTLDYRSLPAAGPVTSSTDLRRVDVSEASAAHETTFTLHAEYQTFSAPEEVLQVAVPGYQLVFTQAGSRTTATVPGFSFASSPFRHDLTPIVDLTVLRPDRPVALADLTWPKLEILAATATAMLAVLAITLVEGRAPWRRSRAPFALAARQIGKTPDFGPGRLLLLHRALDATAGERVLADDLEGFLQKHRRFSALRDDLRDFFAASRVNFFSDHSNGLHPGGDKLVRLSRALARAERRP